MHGEYEATIDPTDTTREEYLSIKDACGRLGLSRSAVFELIRHHRLKRYRKPRDSRTYIKVDDLEAARDQMPSQRRELIQSDKRPAAAGVTEGHSRGGH